MWIARYQWDSFPLRKAVSHRKGYRQSGLLAMKAAFVVIKGCWWQRVINKLLC